MTVELGLAFDAAKYLVDDDEAQRELLADALASGDRAYVAHALGTIARARGGLTKLAEETGLKRQALHRALGKDGNPTLDTLLKVLTALGLRATVENSEERAKAA